MIRASCGLLVKIRGFDDQSKGVGQNSQGLHGVSGGLFVALAEAEPVWYVAGRDEDPKGLIARQPNRERCYGAVTFAVILMAICFWGVKERARLGFRGISGNDLAPHLKCDADMPFAGLP
jgi:hypothetical protein